LEWKCSGPNFVTLSTLTDLIGVDSHDHGDPDVEPTREEEIVCECEGNEGTVHIGWSLMGKDRIKGAIKTLF
jgi:hypothetical protein